MRDAGVRKGDTSPTAKETAAALKDQYVRWGKLQTKTGSQLFKQELLSRPKEQRPGMTMEYLQAVGKVSRPKPVV